MTRLALSGGAAAIALAWACGAAAQTGPSQIAGKPIFEARLRYEGVDQSGLALRAESVTLRTHLGWETPAWRGLTGLIEVEDVRRLGSERYNVAAPGVPGGSVNGRTAYPIINDPETTELNRAQVSWAARKDLSLTAGRQRIVFDDQRFIGNIGWRQDEQTFDAFRADVNRGRIKATYAYLWRVDRVLGKARDWRSDSHLLKVDYALAEPLKLQGFVYALDFSNAPVSSTLTWGAKASGAVKLGPAKLAYNATWARQEDWRGNSAPFALDYWGGDVAATAGIWTARAGVEVLEGNGARGFIMPLSTAHAFNGWADAFAGVGGNQTFVDGLRDLNVQLVARPPVKLRYLSKPELIVRYHDFDAERTGAALGHEWNAQLTAAVTRRLSVALKYADFQRARSAPVGTAAAPASRSKIWMTLEYRL